jgi:hypothetical protein
VYALFFAQFGDRLVFQKVQAQDLHFSAPLYLRRSLLLMLLFLGKEK